jgi:hypothetical protein
MRPKDIQLDKSLYENHCEHCPHPEECTQHCDSILRSALYQQLGLQEIC